jgi:hypothetical protein
MIEIMSALYRRGFEFYSYGFDIYHVRSAYLIGANPTTEPEHPAAARLVAQGDLAPAITINGYRHYEVL